MSDSALCASHWGLPSVSVCMRLRAWEGGCADLEAQLETRRAAVQAEEQR